MVKTKQTTKQIELTKEEISNIASACSLGKSQNLLGNRVAYANLLNKFNKLLGDC